MGPIFRFCFFALFLAGGAQTQPVAPFQLSDYRAMDLSEEMPSALFGKKWHVTKRVFYLKEKVNQLKIHYDDIEFFPDGSFRQGGTEGKWTIEGEKLLHLAFPEPNDLEKNHFLLGGFAVYHLSEQNLILGKMLTSNYDNLIVYFFSASEPYQEAPLPLAFRNSPTGGEKNKWDESIEMLDTDELRQRLKIETFMRGMPYPDGISALSREEILDNLKNLIKGN